MERRAKELIKKMIDADIPIKEQTGYLAELLGKGSQYVRARMTGKASWTFREAQIIGEALSIPQEDMWNTFS